MADAPLIRGQVTRWSKGYEAACVSYMKDLAKLHARYRESVDLPAPEWAAQLPAAAEAISEFLGSAVERTRNVFVDAKKQAIDQLPEQDRLVVLEAVQKMEEGATASAWRIAKISMSSPESRALFDIMDDGAVFENVISLLSTPLEGYADRDRDWQAEKLLGTARTQASSPEAAALMIRAADAFILERVPADIEEGGVEYAVARIRAGASNEAVFLISSVLDGQVLEKAQAARKTSTEAEIAEFVSRNASSHLAAAKMYELLKVKPFEPLVQKVENGELDREFAVHNGAEGLYGAIMMTSSPEVRQRLAPFLDSQVIGALTTITSARIEAEEAGRQADDTQTCLRYMNSVRSNLQARPEARTRAAILNAFVGGRNPNVTMVYTHSQ